MIIRTALIAFQYWNLYRSAKWLALHAANLRAVAEPLKEDTGPAAEEVREKVLKMAEVLDHIQVLVAAQKAEARQFLALMWGLSLNGTSMAQVESRMRNLEAEFRRRRDAVTQLVP